MRRLIFVILGLIVLAGCGTATAPLLRPTAGAQTHIVCVQVPRLTARIICTDMTAPQDAIPHNLSAGIQQVYFLGEWAAHSPRAFRSLDNYAALDQEALTLHPPAWAYIALRYIKTLRAAIKFHDVEDIRTDGAMIQSWARLMGAA